MKWIKWIKLMRISWISWIGKLRWERNGRRRWDRIPGGTWQDRGGKPESAMRLSRGFRPATSWPRPACGSSPILRRRTTGSPVPFRRPSRAAPTAAWRCERISSCPFHPSESCDPAPGCSAAAAPAGTGKQLTVGSPLPSSCFCFVLFCFFIQSNQVN